LRNRRFRASRGASGGREDFVLAAVGFVPELAGVGGRRLSFGEVVVLEAAGFDGAEEAPAEARLRRVAERDGQDPVSEGPDEEGGDAGADAGGVADDPGGVPVAGEGAWSYAPR
jgi:hypothetical protein